DPAILIRLRLLATFQVNDTESPVSQPHGAGDEIPGTIRTAMTNAVGHPLNQFAIDRIPFKIENAADSTH
ncbi:MAG: hypothetical protein WCE53_13535, partial [Candidatus Acidiferrum sp.]